MTENLKTGWREFGGIIGYIYSSEDRKATLNFKDVYYKNNSANAVGNSSNNEYGAIKFENIKNEEIVKAFNNYIDTENKADWKKWKLGENGYPTLID